MIESRGELISRHKRVQAIAAQGASDLVASIEKIIQASGATDIDPDVAASVFVNNFFAEIETNELDTPLQRAIKAEITERVFPSKQ